MSPQKDEIIIRQEQKQHMEDEDSLWTLESPTIILRTESLSASTTTSIGIWPKNVERGKRRKLRNISNATKKGISPRIAKKSYQ